jgi:subtilisin-like proprotein convertase family protein/subtilisin family serine protease
MAVMSFLLRCLPLCLLIGLAQAGPVAFRAPHPVTYVLEVPATPQSTTAVTAAAKELSARPIGGGKTVRITSRLVLRLTDTNQLAALATAHGLVLAGRFDDRTFLLSARDARQAALAANALAKLPGVEVAMPILHRQLRKHFAYGAAPNDPYYPRQPYLEAPRTNAPFFATAPDLNVRGAWAFTHGAGVTVALVDDGMEVAHSDLVANATGPHHNFFTGTASGAHDGIFNYHGTEVAGLIAAVGGNKLGLSGVAPAARLASWLIFNSVDDTPDDAGMASMFSFALNGPDAVAVQNHSWGNSDFDVLEMSLPEQLAVTQAVTEGRSGRGVVYVRSAGNVRAQDYNFARGVGDANLDAYANDPRQITVGAVRNSGRVSSYSTPGACVLVAAMGGDIGDATSPGLLTTDRIGTRGANRVQNPGDPSSWDYAFDSTGFIGTSASAPLVSGVVALLLAENPNLGWRDVQLVLALAARHIDLADPDLTTNGAGLRVSHNVGFGIPDAGTAVRLARDWSNRPPAVERHYTNATPQDIPDDGLKVRVSGPGVPDGLAAIPASGTVGLHPDAPTAVLPLTDVGFATSAIGANLTGRAALITQQGSTFEGPINNAGAAGAAFAIVENSQGTTERYILRDTYFAKIPAVLVGHDDGEALRALFATNSAARVSLGLDSANYPFAVTDTLVVEHVQVHVAWAHPRMADLRVTLRSPSGTVSLLHRPGASTSAVQGEWTYSTVHHLGESSAGTWTVVITDEDTGMTGSVDSVELILHGTPITDADADGLDDAWELAHFGSLNYGPQDDPDHDGWSNATEQLRGSDPMVNETPLALDISRSPNGQVRLSWPGRNAIPFDVLQVAVPEAASGVLQTVPGRFPESGVWLPASDAARYFRVRETP